MANKQVQDKDKSNIQNLKILLFLKEAYLFDQKQ